MKTKCKNVPSQSLSKQVSHKTPKTHSSGQLSTLDNWLSELDQTSKPKSGKKSQLTIRLEKLDLLNLKATLNSTNSSQESTVVKVKSKKTNRSSEYIKLANKQYKCANCSYTTDRTINIRTHFDKEHSTSTFKCDLCAFETRQQYYFNSHIKYHNMPAKECPHCGKMIKAFSYKMHIKVHERNDETEYKCSFCNYQSYNHANVKRHTLTLHKNADELPLFYCDTCSYATILEERLKRHKMQVHLKEGVWISCPQCEYTTRNKGHMKRHKNTHSEKTVQCSQCQQLFGTKEHLRYHVKRMHSEEDSKMYYYCEMCPQEERYRTTEKGNLARHILAHRTLDEIEVFACHKCSYMGKSKNALKIHLINAHLPEMHSFKCRICGYSTNLKSRFKCHLKDVHGKPKQTQEPMETAPGMMSLEEEDLQSGFANVNLIKEETIDVDDNPLLPIGNELDNNNVVFKRDAA